MVTPSPITSPITAVRQARSINSIDDADISHIPIAQTTSAPNAPGKLDPDRTPNLTIATWLGLGLAAGALIATVYFGRPMLQLAFWTAKNDFREACWADRQHGIVSAACDLALEHGAMAPPGTLGTRDLYGWQGIANAPFDASPPAHNSVLRRPLAACYAGFAHTVVFLYSTEQHSVSFKLGKGTHTFSAGTFETVVAGLIALLFMHHWLRRLDNATKKFIHKVPVPAKVSSESEGSEGLLHPARSKTPWRLIELAFMSVVTALIFAWTLSASSAKNMSGNCTGTIGCLLRPFALGLVFALVMVTLTGDVRLSCNLTTMYILLVALVDFTSRAAVHAGEQH